MITRPIDDLIGHFHYVASEIKTIWEAGMEADESVTNFIASSLASPSIQHLTQVISSPSNSERDSLVDLLLYPDEAFQEALEPIVQDHPISMADEKRVIDWLYSCQIAIIISLPSFEGQVTIQPSRRELERAVGRLNLNWRVPDALSQAINHYIKKEWRALVTVRLRNAGLKLNEPSIRFFCDFIKVFPDLTGRFSDHFQFVVDFLSTLPEKPILEALMAERKRLNKGLRQSVHFEKAWPKSNIETLMLKGVQAPADSAGYYRSRIALIGDIIGHVFGKRRSTKGNFPVY